MHLNKYNSFSVCHLRYANLRTFLISSDFTFAQLTDLERIASSSRRWIQCDKKGQTKPSLVCSGYTSDPVHIWQIECV